MTRSDFKYTPKRPTAHMSSIQGRWHSVSRCAFVSYELGLQFQLEPIVEQSFNWDCTASDRFEMHVEMS